MRFLIIIPTIRPPIDTMVAATWRSLSYPTDLHVLDGVEGLAQTYNYALRHHLDVERHDIFVKVDDDLLLPRGWQDVIVRAFELIPLLGACGIDLSDTDEGRRYMAEVNPIIQCYEEVRFRQNLHMNVGGMFTAIPSRLAVQVGEVDILRATRYQYYEDSWRCGRIKALGHIIGYVMTDDKPTILHYEDSPDYIVQKDRDLEEGRRFAGEIQW